MTALDYRTNLGGIKSTKCGNFVRGPFLNDQNIKTQMKAHLFDSKNPLFIIGSLARFKLACKTNRMREELEMWVIPRYVNETFLDALNSFMCATDKSTLIEASVDHVENRSRNLLRSY